ncbi:type IV pilus modification PilV family protein [Alteribacillus iranensis]|uniref:Type IV pilin N-term methylation site GFxxxE n=1 Tax=Alteribacillus iranensis TaxID=930128 RepID=A0A1I2CPV3_9BACI|nr:type II secretion system protein [Alteribacillus iranensis]SFE70377.1 Type IV pilin N-term methylation site GFxxxE [Alteribacillus iranensis]
MKRMEYLHSNKGITLVELLVSITLLSIVIVTFLGFFSQSITFSAHTEDKLTSLNIAEDVLIEAKEDISPAIEEPRRMNNKTYYPIVDILSQSSEERSLNIARIHVKVYAEEVSNQTLYAELYGYIDCEDSACGDD